MPAAVQPDTTAEIIPGLPHHPAGRGAAVCRVCLVSPISRLQLGSRFRSFTVRLVPPPLPSSRHAAVRQRAWRGGDRVLEDNVKFKAIAVIATATALSLGMGGGGGAGAARTKPPPRA